MDENKEVITNEDKAEENSALESFLNRDPEEKKPEKKDKKKLSKNKLYIIIGAIAILIVAGIICLLVFLPSSSEGEDASYTTEDADISVSVDDDNIHQAVIATDEKGNILQGGGGELITQEVTQIKQIDLKNQSGNYTVLSETPTTTNEDGDEETSTTIYTLVGFEKFDIKSGAPDAIANACANLSFTDVVSTGDNLKDYGLDNPRAVATTTFTDDTTSIIKVGDDAPQETGTYITFGTKNTVYLADKDVISALLYSINDLIALEVTTNADTTDTTDFNKVTLSGTNFDPEVVIIKNDDEAITSTYKMTAPYEAFVDETEGANISGGIRGIMAAEVICVNPDSSDLEKYGLSKPYAKLVAEYDDTTIKLISSQPKENSVYLMNDGDKVIYRVADTSVPWVSTSVKKLRSQLVLAPDMEKVSSMTVTDSTGTYTFKLTTTTDTVEDENGENQEVTVTTASYDGEDLDTTNFNTFFQNLDSMNVVSDVTNESTSSSALTITFKYSTGRADDTIVVYNSDSTKCAVTLNGKDAGAIYKSYATKFSKALQQLISGETVSNI